MLSVTTATQCHQSPPSVNYGVQQVAVRDELCKAIVKLGKEPLSPPMRRQLSLCTDALGDAEPRAIMPLVLKAPPTLVLPAD